MFRMWKEIETNFPHSNQSFRTDAKSDQIKVNKHNQKPKPTWNNQRNKKTTKSSLTKATVDDLSKKGILKNELSDMN